MKLLEDQDKCVLGENWGRNLSPACSCKEAVCLLWWVFDDREGVCQRPLFPGKFSLFLKTTHRFSFHFSMLLTNAVFTLCSTYMRLRWWQSTWAGWCNSNEISDFDKCSPVSVSQSGWVENASHRREWWQQNWGIAFKKWTKVQRRSRFTTSSAFLASDQLLPSV